MDSQLLPPRPSTVPKRHPGLPPRSCRAEGAPAPSSQGPDPRHVLFPLELQKRPSTETDPPPCCFLKHLFKNTFKWNVFVSADCINYGFANTRAPTRPRSELGAASK